MSSKKKKLTERTDIGSIMLLLMITGVLTFIIPGYGIINQSDIYVVLGTLLGVYFIIKKEFVFKDRVKNLLLLTLFGGLFSALDLTVIAILIATSLGKAYRYPFTLFYLWYIYITITMIIIIGLIIIYLYFQESAALSNSK